MQFWLEVKLNGRTFFGFGPFAQLNRCKCRFCGCFVQCKQRLSIEKWAGHRAPYTDYVAQKTKCSLFVVVFQ